ncbi:hypothetical protein SAMN05216548_101413 [Faunimonas pinastri]|uniref:DUF5666 domain-containing protein n=1 Tax=Faunimonas pinastri TaxID=1855383 RepID=A0A1H9AFW3_9HYPH|nr:hypothetical protein [Faunimonas pinastri]SEP75401.1 hypothetical protein SAMN05216548_101413 [Faunimonas pinastri]
MSFALFRPALLRAGLIGSLLPAALVAVPMAAFAQDAAPTRIRGTIGEFSGQTLTVKTREGKDVQIKLAPGFTVSAVKKFNLADIKSGDFIGSAAKKGPDGKLEAMEVTVFPESARGTGEGHYGWDAGPNSSMTNATVAKVDAAPTGRTLALTYKGGSVSLDVPEDAPVVTFEPGTPDMLMPGKAVFVVAKAAADGAISANRVAVEHDGVKPPM